jgi:type II secretory pathway pseudopilin PulG
MKKGGTKSLAGFTRLASKQVGFTIVETMIVLAVTGGMLIIAVMFVSGRQNRTEFQTSINDLQQQLQQIINETNSGHYNNNGDFSCNGTGALVTLSGGSNSQGSNAGCIFMGNAIQFGTGTSGNLPSQLGIIPIVGKQYATGTQPVQIVDDAKPRAVYPTGTETIPSDAFTTVTMQYGLSVAASAPGCPSVGICYDAVAGGTKAAGTLAIITGDRLGKIASPDGGNLKPGMPQFTLYGVVNTTPNQDTPSAVQAIGNFISTPTQGLEPAKSATICIASGTTDQSGLFKITADLHVTLQIFAGPGCT